MQKFREALEKLRGLTELQKKIIVWGVTILVGLGLLGWWVSNTQSRFSEHEGPSIEQQLRIPELREQFEHIPYGQ